MKSFFTCIISYVSIFIIGLCPSLDAAQKPATSSTSSSMSSSSRRICQPLDLNLHPQAVFEQKSPPVVQETKRRRFDEFQVNDNLRIGQRNMIIICDDGSDATKGALNMLVTAITQKPAACIVIHERLWTQFLSEDVTTLSATTGQDGAVALNAAGILNCKKLFDESFWEMYAIRPVSSPEVLYLLVPKLYKELILGNEKELLASRAAQQSARVQKTLPVERDLKPLEKDGQQLSSVKERLEPKIVTEACKHKKIVPQNHGIIEARQIILDGREQGLEQGHKLDEYRRCVCVPDTSKTVHFSQEMTPTVAKSDVAFGLRLSKLYRIEHPLQLAPVRAIGSMGQGVILQQLPKIFQSIFVSMMDIDRAKADNSLLNSWNIFMYGHGTPTEFDTTFVRNLEVFKHKFEIFKKLLPISPERQSDDLQRARKDLFVGNDGHIAGLPVYTFAELFDFFNVSIKTNFFYLLSCFASAEHMALLRAICPDSRQVTMATAASTFAPAVTVVEQNVAVQPLSRMFTESSKFIESWVSSLLCEGQSYARTSSQNFNLFFMQLANPALPLGDSASCDFYTRVTNFANKFLSNGKVCNSSAIPAVSIGRDTFSVANLGDDVLNITSQIADLSMQPVDARGKKIIIMSTRKLTIPLIGDKDLQSIVPMIDTATFGQLNSNDFVLPKIMFFKEILFTEPGQPLPSEVIDFVVKRMCRLFQKDDILWPINTIVCIKKLVIGATVVDDVCLMFRVCGQRPEWEDEINAWFVDERGRTHLITYKLNEDGVIINKNDSNALQQIEEMPYELFYHGQSLHVLGDDDYARIFGDTRLAHTKQQRASNNVAASSVSS